MTFDVRIPDSVLLHKALSPQAKALYGLIAAVPNHDPSRRQITDTLGFNSATATKARAELERAGLIIATRPTRRIGKRLAESVRCTLTGGVSRRYIRITAAAIEKLKSSSAPTATAIIVLAEQRRRAMRKEKPAKAPALAARLGISIRSAQTANRSLRASGLLQSVSAQLTPEVVKEDGSVPDFDTYFPRTTTDVRIYLSNNPYSPLLPTVQVDTGPGTEQADSPTGRVGVLTPGSEDDGVNLARSPDTGKELLVSGARP